MDMTLMVIALLMGIIVYQQWFFMRQVQELVNKLMSRSFMEYKNTVEPPPPRVKIDDSVPEDLRALQEFQGMMST